MIYFLIYLVGCVATGVYAYKNLDPEDYNDYYNSAIVITSMGWPLIVLAMVFIVVKETIAGRM